MGQILHFQVVLAMDRRLASAAIKIGMVLRIVAAGRLSSASVAGHCVFCALTDRSVANESATYTVAGDISVVSTISCWYFCMF